MPISRGGHEDQGCMFQKGRDEERGKEFKATMGLWNWGNSGEGGFERDVFRHGSDFCDQGPGKRALQTGGNWLRKKKKKKEKSYFSNMLARVQGGKSARPLQGGATIPRVYERPRLGEGGREVSSLMGEKLGGKKGSHVIWQRQV